MAEIFFAVLFIGFNVYFFPIYHILVGLRAVFILKHLKAGLCLIIGGAILAVLVYYGFYSSITIPWLKQWIILLWLIGGLPCYIGIYMIDKEKNKLNPVAFFIRTICFVLGLIAVIN